MASAYTPGLTVGSDIVVRRTRRLPIKGEVLVHEGQVVEPDTVVARALLPGNTQSIKLAEKLGVEAKDALDLVRVKAGDPIEVGQVVAESKGLFGLFKQSVASEYSGTVEEISSVTGNILVREAPIPVDVKAYIRGTVATVLPEEGAIIETQGGMVQGIFGVGGERTGKLRIAVGGPSDELTPEGIADDDRGALLVGGSGVSYGAIQKAAAVGVVGIVVGGIKDSDLTRYLGYDIGVAITGQEQIPLTIVVTEGFGFLAMAERTFKLLESLAGCEASFNGATQIRAGVIRPEIIVPQEPSAKAAPQGAGAFELKIGAPIRVIREPYFGEIASVTGLPAELVTVDSGTEVRVLRAKLARNGEEVVVPRANVEIIASS